MQQYNPFSKFTTRSLIFWAIVGSPFLRLLLESILSPYQNLDLQDPLAQSILGNGCFYLTVGLWFLWYKKRSHLKFALVFGQLPSSKHWLRLLLLVLPILLFSLGAGQIIYYLVSLISPKIALSAIEHQVFLTGEKTDFPIIYNSLQLFFIVIAAPIVEEVLFRGLILPRWSIKWGTISGLTFSSLFFGLLHFNALGLFNFGLVMALLYLRTQTLFVPIMAHFLNNLVAAMIELGSFLSKDGGVDTLEQIQTTWWQGLIAIALSLPWIIWFWRNNWQFSRQVLPYFANRERAINKIEDYKDKGIKK